MKFVSQKILFLLFSLKEEKLCLEKEYQEQPKLAVSIAGTVMIKDEFITGYSRQIMMFH